MYYVINIYNYDVKNHGKLVNHNWFIRVPFPRDRQEAIRDVKTGPGGIW